MNRRNLLYFVLLAGLGLSSLYTFSQLGSGSGSGPALPVRLEREEPPYPPTIVLMIADDHLYRDFGFAGSAEAYTPTLDRLAGEGALFPLAHVTQSRCRPSLASLLTGLYPQQHRIYYNNHGAPYLDRQLDTLPRLLRDRGYQCWLGGKFWEGDPRELGFTHGEKNEPMLARRNQNGVQRFLAQARRQPVFMWWAPMLPHNPHDAAPEFVARVDESKIHRPPYVSDTRWKMWRTRRARYLANVARLDAAVGELLQILGEAGRLENTLIVFLSDNGWDIYPAKGTIYERGIRTPVFLWDPKRIAPTTRADAMISSLDVVPTILEWAGAASPPNCEGRSLWPLLSIETPPTREKLFGTGYPFYASIPEHPDPTGDLQALYVRTERWKYALFVRELPPASEWIEPYERNTDGVISIPAGKETLFNLEGDPEELENLASDPEYQDVVRDLRAEVLDWWRSTGGGPLPVDAGSGQREPVPAEPPMIPGETSWTGNT